MSDRDILDAIDTGAPAEDTSHSDWFLDHLNDQLDHFGIPDVPLVDIKAFLLSPPDTSLQVNELDEWYRILTGHGTLSWSPPHPSAEMMVLGHVRYYRSMPDVSSDRIRRDKILLHRYDCLRRCVSFLLTTCHQDTDQVDGIQKASSLLLIVLGQIEYSYQLLWIDCIATLTTAPSDDKVLSNGHLDASGNATIITMLLHLFYKMLDLSKDSIMLDIKTPILMEAFRILSLSLDGTYRGGIDEEQREALIKSLRQWVKRPRPIQWDASLYDASLCPILRQRVGVSYLDAMRDILIITMRVEDASPDQCPAQMRFSLDDRGCLYPDLTGQTHNVLGTLRIWSHHFLSTNWDDLFPRVTRGSPHTTLTTGEEAQDRFSNKLWSLVVQVRTILSSINAMGLDNSLLGPKSGTIDEKSPWGIMLKQSHLLYHEIISRADLESDATLTQRRPVEDFGFEEDVSVGLVLKTHSLVHQLVNVLCGRVPRSSVTRPSGADAVVYLESLHECIQSYLSQVATRLPEESSTGYIRGKRGRCGEYQTDRQDQDIAPEYRGHHRSRTRADESMDTRRIEPMAGFDHSIIAHFLHRLPDVGLALYALYLLAPSSLRNRNSKQGDSLRPVVGSMNGILMKQLNVSSSSLPMISEERSVGEETLTTVCWFNIVMVVRHPNHVSPATVVDQLYHVRLMRPFTSHDTAPFVYPWSRATLLGIVPKVIHASQLDELIQSYRPSGFDLLDLHTTTVLAQTFNEDVSKKEGAVSRCLPGGGRLSKVDNVSSESYLAKLHEAISNKGI